MAINLPKLSTEEIKKLGQLELMGLEELENCLKSGIIDSKEYIDSVRELDREGALDKTSFWTVVQDFVEIYKERNIQVANEIYSSFKEDFEKYT